MSQLLSSPPISVNSNPFISPRFHSSSSVLVAGGFAVTRRGTAWKPTTTLKLSVKSRQTEYFEKQRFGDSSSSPSYSSQNAEGVPARFYVGHSIYKGKAALQVEPRAPEFVALDSGAFKLSKDGFLLLQFAPAAGVRQYDWSKKQVFYEFECRTPDQRNIFSGILKNYLFLGTIIVTVILQVIVIECLGIFISTVRLDAKQWLISIGIGFFSQVAGRFPFQAFPYLRNYDSL